MHVDKNFLISYSLLDILHLKMFIILLTSFSSKDMYKD
jgi:hypothetical protein